MPMDQYGRATPAYPGAPTFVPSPMGGSPGYAGIPSNMQIIPHGAPIPKGATRYSQALSPSATFWGQMERNYAPWGPARQDPPAAGSGGFLGKLLGSLPYIGGMASAGMAASQASGHEGNWYANPEPSMFERVLGVIGNTLGYVPGGGAGMNIAKNVVSGTQGLIGAPGMFNTSWEQMFSGMAGSGVNKMFQGMQDRTGTLRDMFQPPQGGIEDFQMPQAQQNFALPREPGFDFSSERMG